MRRTSTLLALLAVGCSAVAAADVPIRDIRLTLEPTTYSGPCPVRLRAHVVFVSNFPTRADEDNWGWNFGHLSPHTWDVLGGHLRTSGRETAIDTTLTIPHAGETGGGLLHEGSVYVIMEINPTISNTVRYSVRCSPAVTIDPKVLRTVVPGPTIAVPHGPTIPASSGGGAGLTVRLPDLVPEILDPNAGRFAVRNTGDGPAGPSTVLVRCRAVSGGTGSRGGCPDVPGVAALYDPALDGLVMPVPALLAGGTHTIYGAGDGWAEVAARQVRVHLHRRRSRRDPRAKRGEQHHRAYPSHTDPHALKDKGPGFWPGPFKLPGSDLLSHTVSRAVPSAVSGLTSVFGMGTGGTPSIWPPETLFRFRTESS